MPIYQPRVLNVDPLPPEQLIVHGPIVPVIVTITEREAQIRGGKRPVLPINAMLDTGARGTVISARIAKDLQLVGIDKVNSLGVHGAAQQRNVYSVDFTFQGSNLGFTKWRVIEADLETGFTQMPLDMLIGRDVLSWVDFRYDGAKADFRMEIPSPSHPGHPNHPINKQDIVSLPQSGMPTNQKRKNKKAMAKASRKKNRR
jgi:hypothetical protein